jgi:flagellar hook-associated protein FlgK
MLSDVISDVREEVIRAEELHKPINSLHEGYAVIAEELDEFWDQVKRKARDRDPVAVRTELIQTAAMCVRTITNVLDRVAG